MIRKQPSPARSRNLKILLSVTLAVAAVLIVILLFVPEKEGRSAEAQGILLCPDGESKVCTVTLQGVMKTYAFRQDAPIYEGTLLLDGKAVGELSLTFSGDLAASGSEGVPAVMTKEMEIAAQIGLDGKDCLVLAPAPDKDAAQKLLSQFLADSVFARQLGWEAFQAK